MNTELAEIEEFNQVAAIEAPKTRDQIIAESLARSEAGGAMTDEQLMNLVAEDPSQSELIKEWVKGELAKPFAQRQQEFTQKLIEIRRLLLPL